MAESPCEKDIRGKYEKAIAETDNEIAKLKAELEMLRKKETEQNDFVAEGGLIW